VPVYGCGFLHENSIWRDGSLAAMEPPSRERWTRLFDPSSVVGNTRCPILFVNGMHDFAYPPDSHRKTFELVDPALRNLSLRVDMPHGHYWHFPEVDAFIDSAMQTSVTRDQLTRLEPMAVEVNTARAKVLSGAPVEKATLHYTTMAGEWLERKWTSEEAEVRKDEVRAALPAHRPLAFFFTTTDSRGYVTSTHYGEVK